MKGRTLVIGIILFVLLIVGGIYFAMTATINNIKEEGNGAAQAAVYSIEIDAETLTL